ncbi:OmpA family protein [Uruburuella testudinis]|uniref:OmpA family protein n=1 Tax=Uruburuella testudinis TaxID=1282863 RepID=A0ABY4DQU1_9NEIS|nr:OmpA family protein [Uruburuella testudinis]UOO81424.1 OmpA family protein [Uruburuella testudinis]
MKTFGVIAVSLILSACAGAHPKEKWHNFNDQPIDSWVGDNDAGLVFYRDQSGDSHTAVNIVINGEYQTSLQQNGYSQAVVCAQPQRLGAFVTGQGNSSANEAARGNFYNLPRGQLSYFRVSVNQAGQAQLMAVDKATAQAELKNSKHQANTLSRVDKQNTCAPRSAPRQYTLGASALFPFDRSQAADIIPDGRKQIANIAADIREYPVGIKKIEVIGHTDPQGTEAYNQQLSKQRADAVKQLLMQNGVSASLIYAEGKGAAEPVVSHCANQATAAQVQTCNQPNRRVVVKLYTNQQQ